MAESIILLKNVSREFRIVKHKEGIVGAVKNLFHRDYELITAVENVSLKIKKGEIVGYLGPNGSGKSTTIKMMTGILTPTTGEIYINGKVPYKNRSEVAQDIGVVFGQRSQLWWALPLIDSFKVLKELYKISDEAYNEIINFYKSEIEIESLLYKPVRQMSLGQRTLSDILAAFLHNPSIVFLDEPTIGLDVSMKSKVHEIIKKLNKKYQTTVIITTHDMTDVIALCQRVIIINQGKIMFDDSPSKLKEYFGCYRNLVFSIDEVSLKKKEDLINMLKGCSPDFDVNEQNIVIKGRRVNILINEEQTPAIEVLHKIYQHYPISDILIEDIPIESIVKKLFEEKKQVASIQA